MKKAIAIISLFVIAIAGFSQNNLTTVYVKKQNSTALSKNLMWIDKSNTITASDFMTVTATGTTSATNAIKLNGVVWQSSGQRGNYTSVAANYTLTASDYVVDLTVDSTTTVLPTAVGKTGQVYILKADDAGTNTISTTSSQTIDGSTTKAVTTKKTLIVMSNGANWIILSYN